MLTSNRSNYIYEYTDGPYASVNLNIELPLRAVSNNSRSMPYPKSSVSLQAPRPPKQLFMEMVNHIIIIPNNYTEPIPLL